MRHNGEGVGHCHNLFLVSENADEVASDDEMEIDNDDSVDGVGEERGALDSEESSEEASDDDYSSNGEGELDEDNEGIDLDALF